VYLEGTLFLRNILVDLEGTLLLCVALLEKSKDLMPSNLGVSQALGSLMREYQHFGAYLPYTFTSDRH